MTAVPANSVQVSVVMPAYNARRYIAAAIESVLSQTFRDFELIVVDDCSKDDTTAIVRDFAARDPRVRLIVLPKNCGAPAGPRNTGVRVAIGQWIAFLDADDIWHPEKLSCQMEAVARMGSSFCSTRMTTFVDARELVFADPGNFSIERVGFFKQLVKNRTPTSSVLVRKEVVMRHPFNEDISFKAREDFDCWLRCIEELGDSIKITHTLVGYRIIAGQISGSKWQMVGRHYHVLRHYRFRSGRVLGMGAAFFTLSHFVFAFYHRFLRRGL